MGVMADPSTLAAHIESLGSSRIACVGDVMLDRFVYGRVERTSPEAPVPILRTDHDVYMLGGAGNVVRNLVSLGAHATLLSVIGDDEVGRRLTGMVGREERVEPHLLVERGRLSTEKTRFVAGSQQLLPRRFGDDRGDRAPRGRQPDRPRAGRVRGRGRGGPLRLRQGGPHAGPVAAPDRGRPRRGPPGGGRSQGPRLWALRRRHGADAEPAPSSPMPQARAWRATTPSSPPAGRSSTATLSARSWSPAAATA